MTLENNSQHRFSRLVVASLTASVAIVGSNSLALGPMAPDIAADLNTPLASVLHASAAFGAGTAVSAFFLARYIDRAGIRTSLQIALLVLMLAFIGSALSVEAWQLVIAQFAAGLAAGVILPTCYAGAAVIAPPEHSSKVLGIVLTGWTISLVLGVTLSTLIADQLHWRSVYGLFAAAAAIVTICNLMAGLPNARQQQQPVSMLTALRIKKVPGLLIQVACYMTAFYGVYNLIGDHVVSTLNHSLSANALIALSYGLGFGLATLFDPMLDRLMPVDSAADQQVTQRSLRQSIITAASLMTLALLYIGLALSSGKLATLIMAAAMWGLLNHIGLNILIASLNATTTDHRGAVLGLYSGITYVCMSVGTVLFSLVYPGVGFIGLCMIASMLCAGAFVVAVAGRRKLQV